MAPEIFRIVIVDTVESEQAVQACLQSFGHISRIVFWKKDQDKVNRYFVEFIVPESVGRACKFYLRDFRVHALASSKQLVDVFASLTGSGSSRNGHSTAPTRTSTLPIPRRDSISSAKDIDRTHKSKPSSSSTSNGARNPPLLPAAAIQSPLLPSKPAFPSSSSNHASSTNHSIDQNANKASDRPVHATSALTVTANMSGLSISNGQTHKSRVPSDRVGDDVPAYLSVSPGGPIRPNAIIPDGLPPLRTTISLSLYGERIHYDLSTLEGDPSTIIRLLKMTGSDRDHWMIVASWYRRAGKLHAAVLVVSKMLEVMKANGLKEADLRPAFLMLASCHTELRRRVIAFHGKETDESRSEHDRARRCLQKVHGINDTDPDTPGHGPQTMANSSPTLTRSQASTTITRPTSAGRLASSSRELQLLRERHTSHLSQLAEVIAGKRKAEDTITQERVIRRRLEREKAELEHQLTLAQEREQRAQELVHLEKMGRIDAEQRASEEEQKRIDAEKGAGPLLEALSTVFSRAATGADVSALAAGIMQVTSA